MPATAPPGAAILLSGQFSAFGVVTVQQGPRGSDQLAAPNWFMLDAGRGVGSRQFLNLELMGTFERWTYPRRGYAELLQIGEQRSDGTPFVDAQHPHSSPIMGLTLSNTFTLNDSRSLRLSFAPRGESADGPVAFMHRDSARDNPDAPLGHHVGQDVGHISSTVVAALLNLGSWSVEASTFNGAEPEPTRVNLPLGALNSEALRVTYSFTTGHRLMASWAHVEQADPEYPGTTSATRLSSSLYDHLALADGRTLDNALIVGNIARHPGGGSLTSLLDEAVFARGASDFWGRAELLQRLRYELGIAPQPAAASAEHRWIQALTLGYSRWFSLTAGTRASIGLSVTVDHVPGDWALAYGHQWPLTERLIFQIRGSGRRTW